MFCNTSRISQSGLRTPKASERSFSPGWRSPLGLPKFTAMMPHHPTDYFAAEEAMMAAT
jgi:hypothetical protein